jgi:hypothetical protein
MMAYFRRLAGFSFSGPVVALASLFLRSLAGKIFVMFYPVGGFCLLFLQSAATNSTTGSVTLYIHFLGNIIEMDNYRSPRCVWEKSGRHDLGGEGGAAIPLTKFLFISYKG